MTFFFFFLIIVGRHCLSQWTWWFRTISTLDPQLYLCWRQHYHLDYIDDKRKKVIMWLVTHAIYCIFVLYATKYNTKKVLCGMISTEDHERYHYKQIVIHHITICIGLLVSRTICQIFVQRYHFTILSIDGSVIMCRRVD